MNRKRRPKRVLPDAQPDHAEALLVIALQVAIPLHIAQFANKGEDGRAYLAHAPISCGLQLRSGPCPCSGLADIVATHSAAMAGGDRGDAAKAFNAIAQALALAVLDNYHGAAFLLRKTAEVRSALTGQTTEATDA